MTTGARGLRQADVVVIGAGQAGLSAGHHLQRRGYAALEPGAGGEVDGAAGDGRTFVILDAEDGPGGAWRHRWPSLVMATVNGIFDLPGYPQDPVDPSEPSREAVPRYFAAYERLTGLPVHRPVTVTSVQVADDVADLGTDAGHRVLRITRKGGKRARVVLPAATVRALEAYLAGRAHGPLFCNSPERAPRPWPGSHETLGQVDALRSPPTATPPDGPAVTGAPPVDAAGPPLGTGLLLLRWQYGPASRLLTQLFAGVGVSDQATAHSFRHSWVTESLGLGIPLQDVQDAAGHADPRTTRRYHRSRDHLDRSPNDRLAASLLE